MASAGPEMAMPILDPSGENCGWAPVMPCSGNGACRYGRGSASGGEAIHRPPAPRAPRENTSVLPSGESEADKIRNERVN